MLLVRVCIPCLHLDYTLFVLTDKVENGIKYRKTVSVFLVIIIIVFLMAIPEDFRICGA